VNTSKSKLTLFQLHHQLFEAERHYWALSEAEDIVNGMHQATQLYTPWLDALQGAVTAATLKASHNLDEVHELIEELVEGEI
tara:strand:- start:820 stop:1065 length:246 start_codon:yes stop_codon:yes gene_type:complete